MRRIITVFLVSIIVVGCGGGKIPILGDLFGYVEPPKTYTVGEELRMEFDRCMKIGEEKNCAQWAFDIVRKVKGMEPRTVPEGVVIIMEGDGNITEEEEKTAKDAVEQDNEQ